MMRHLRPVPIGVCGAAIAALLASWAAAPPSTQAAAASRKTLRLLVVTGGHDYPTSFYALFEGHPDLTWDHATSAEEAYRRDLRPHYDVLVLYDMPKDLSPAGRANLQAFAESGKGIVVLHHALASYPGWAWYEQLVGARYLEAPAGGRPASTYQHDVDFTLTPAREHPVVAGLGPMRLHDETYKGVWHDDRVLPLLTADHPTSDRVVAWVSPYARSRVVAIQPGHGAEAHRDPAYRRLLRQAIVWAAGRPA